MYNKLTSYLAYTLAAFMVFMGIQKFFGDAPIFKIIGENTGLNFVDPYLGYVTGFMEIAAAALLVFGKRFAGSILSVFIILGAVSAHLTVLGVMTPMSSEPDAEKSPVLFLMALVYLVISGLVAFASVTAASNRD